MGAVQSVFPSPFSAQKFGTLQRPYPAMITNDGYNWTLNFRQCYEEKQVGEFVTSPVFLDDYKRKWRFTLYPRGDCEKNKNYVSLYLEILGKFHESLNPWFWMSLVDVNNRPVNKKLSNDKYCVVDGEVCEGTWGFSRFIPCNEILNNNNELLHVNDGIMIRFVLCSMNKTDYEKTLIDYAEEASPRCLPKPKIYFDYEQMMKNHDFSDATLISSDGIEFPVHKAILSVRSPYFDAKFSDDYNDYNMIEDVRSEVLEQLLLHVYTSQAEKLELMSQELLVAADKYGLDDLKDKCEEFICSGITLDNSMELLVFADLYEAKVLKMAVINFLIDNAKDVVKIDNFKAMEKTYPHLIAEVCQKMALR